MIDRRAFMGAGAALLAMPVRAGAPPVVPGTRLGFDVLYRGMTLGTHVLTFDRAGDALSVGVAVDLAFRVLGVTLYRFTQRASERWVGDQLVSLQSTSVDNGTRIAFTAQRGAQGLVVAGDRTPRYVAPADALPSTHWNRRELDGPWIDSQDGRLLRPRVAPGPVEAVPTASGARVNARRYALTGDARLDLFYDERLGWAGLTFQKRGAPVRYVRQGL